MPTYFMRVFGHDQMNVSARTVIERQTTGMELALVMDNTGSMWNSDTATNLAGTPFAAMRDAALNLVDIIYGEEDELDNVWVSLVPYVAAVNIGPTRTGWLDASDGRPRRRRAAATTLTSVPSATGGAWKGCVMARAYPWDTDDSTPSTHPFTSFFYPKTSTDNNYTWTTINDSHTGTNQARKGPNLGCGTPITPLTEVADDDRGRDQRDAAVAARRHHRQPRAGLGMADDLARLARPLGRRRPAARLRHRLHGQGRRDPDRRQQRVLQPSRRLERRPVDALRLHGLRPRQRPRSRRARRRRPRAPASPSSTTG